MNLSNLGSNKFKYHIDHKKFWDDYEFVLGAVKIRGKFITYANKKFRNDFTIVLNSVKMNGMCLKYASNFLKNNLEIVTCAIQNNPKSIKYASGNIRDYPDIMMKVFKRNYKLMRHASPRIRESKVIARECLNIDVKYFDFLDEKLKADPEILLDLLKRCNPSKFYRLCPKNLLNDKEFILKLVKHNFGYILKIPEKFQTDYDIAKLAKDIYCFPEHYIHKKFYYNRRYNHEILKIKFLKFRSYKDDWYLHHNLKNRMFNMILCRF